MGESITIAGVVVEFDDVEPRPRLTSEQVKERVERRMSRIDALTPAQRLVVHEFGWCLVDTFMKHGVKNPKSMRALINAVTHAVINRADR